MDGVDDVRCVLGWLLLRDDLAERADAIKMFGVWVYVDAEKSRTSSTAFIFSLRRRGRGRETGVWGQQDNPTTYIHPPLFPPAPHRLLTTQPPSLPASPQQDSQLALPRTASVQEAVSYSPHQLPRMLEGEETRVVLAWMSGWLLCQ
jgi:hypothetical protein